jgi:O-methyltransferase
MSSKHLDLLKLVLTGYVFPESSDVVIRRKAGRGPRALAKNLIVDQLGRYGFRLVKRQPFDAAAREHGRDWPSIAYTMVGIKRLDNVQHAIETVIYEDIPGDAIECGVWRGGCSMFMRAVMDEVGAKDRILWLADSFDGMPKPDSIKFPADLGYDLSENDYLSVPLESVKANFERFRLGSENTRFLKGWFNDTLPSAPIQKISVLRADGDLYESTMDILKNLYDKVSPGGFVIIDDYFAWKPCELAVSEFRKAHGITAKIHDIDGIGAYWRV